MIRRTFGKTGLDLSVLSFGAMRIPPEKGEAPEDTQKRAFDTLRCALDAGINHIETARGYGESEALIGAALREGVIRRDEFILTTKIAPKFSAADFRQMLTSSMATMGVTRVDNLDVHGINTREHLEMVTAPDGCMAAVREMQAEGLVGSIGFSTHAPLELILETIETELFESINLHYYFFNPRNKPAVDLATKHGMGVFIISPTDKGGQLFKPSQRLIDLCYPYTPIQMNQRWLLSQPEVHTLSLGLAKPEELDAHLLGVNDGGPATPEEQAIFARALQAIDMLGDSYCNYCWECLPCPENVQIPEILRLRNLTVAYGMGDFGRYRYNLLAHKGEDGKPEGGGGHWFPGVQADFCTNCGDCLPRCPAKLPIPQLLAETHETLVGQAAKRLWE